MRCGPEQALREIFRFRDATQPQRPLAEPLDYELLRGYLRSGEAVAHSFLGPFAFNALGQNTGREPTTLQVFAGRARAVLPDTGGADRNHSLSYPAPAALGLILAVDVLVVAGLGLWAAAGLKGVATLLAVAAIAKSRRATRKA